MGVKCIHIDRTTRLRLAWLMTIAAAATTTFILIGCLSQQVHGQRNLLNWRHDIQFRLEQYHHKRRVIDNILDSSIHHARQHQLNPGPSIVEARSNVRFTDLIIPNGSLVLERQFAHRTVSLLVDKTRTYVDTKLQALRGIRNIADSLNSQMSDPARNFIYKGLPGHANHQNVTTYIPGVRRFFNFVFGRSIQANSTFLQQINMTNVTQVLDNVYMQNLQYFPLDRKSRLFIEGTKILSDSVFHGELRSGCCDRLRPLHTNHMLTRTANQEVRAPTLIAGLAPVKIEHLNANQLVNRQFGVVPGPPDGRTQEIRLLPGSLPENSIQMANLIPIGSHGFNQPKMMKTLIFRREVSMQELHLQNSVDDNRLTIHVDQPPLRFDLAHDNYLLRYYTNSTYRNPVVPPQHVRGPVWLTGRAFFGSNLDANFVNNIQDFRTFAEDTIVRVDRPAQIMGSVQFDTLPPMTANLPPNSAGGPMNTRVPVIQIVGPLQVDTVNNMHLPQDVLLLPLMDARAPIHIWGSRQFGNGLSVGGELTVRGTVNGLVMPAEIIPLFQDDSPDGTSIGVTNLWFVNGIEARDLFIDSGRFDWLDLNNIYGDANSFIMRAALQPQPDGTLLIRAPLEVEHLVLPGGGGSGMAGIQDDRGYPLGGGFLNGFRPADVPDLTGRRLEVVYGAKHFLAPIKAQECIIDDLNGFPDWTNHLIRIDRPISTQTVHSRLAFIGEPGPVMPTLILNATSRSARPAGSVRIENLSIEFFQNKHPLFYQHNMHFSPEFYVLHQALLEQMNDTRRNGRIRVLNEVRLGGRVNQVDLNDVIKLNEPMQFLEGYTMVGKVRVQAALNANRIASNYPIDVMDIVQFNKFRIPIRGASQEPIRLNHLNLGPNNEAAYLNTRAINGIPFDEFANAIMSLTRPQTVEIPLNFEAPVYFEGIVESLSSLNDIQDFQAFAKRFTQRATRPIEDGLRCNTLLAS